MNKKILLSGVKPTGRPHIGNYFGAMKQFVELQDSYNSYIFIADLHALTSVQNKDELRENILGVLLDYLAIGLDPEKVTLYKQSDVPQVTELTWILNCLTTVPYLSRAHAYKDAIANGKEPSVGLFDYPILMAADIIIQDADVVPVGQDQKQHIEIARDMAQKFNSTFGDTFKLPDSLILENLATIPGTDGRKMSKSYGNTIELFATDEEISRSVMSIVTDSSGEKPENVYAIHALLKDKESLDKLYEEKKGQYKELKEVLIEDLKKFITPMREKRVELAKDKKSVLEVLKAGSDKARARAEKKMEEVREKVGLKLS
ncbi:MAG: tryptophan--tRNA ligase [Candidatus Zambryskibacteria bacterium RIFCSPHIGHO2_02_FULL_43_14]|uniref:Tryptophan--tRNA ligase n=1 Tax=Candidatus Zambryskibacteria bacterium RIFCSPHIGHO2_02_FULL_43_14 TaxID=1802748 RepID=A0A1G2TI10_9BACT|nr:MAG: tryptophan--tRNA ligase [Candidatus Zambryskibacteria bacterium RIFCSPHIGHO2_01_FULL_43_60]OHA96832.1 MAG: tryptophan--tRNA ligase [Candidatus Zambryskibacteria bacterium RIFCSPHIGHO2_02_FULL_43_14]OHB04088.1 MAG: tryptophan--tRNA ligase [Candidatus Zambryskibacteria bacterium RIFCSPLOWO2_01_FULL_42_41]